MRIVNRGQVTDHARRFAGPDNRDAAILAANPGATITRYRVGRYTRRTVRRLSDALIGFGATLHTFGKPPSVAAATLDGVGDSIITEVETPETGTMTYVMAVKGTDAVGVLVSWAGNAAFGGRYASGGGATGLSTNAGIVISVDGVDYVSGTNTRAELHAALMDGQPHLVKVTGIPNTWGSIEAGNYAQIADQYVAGFLAPIGIFAADAADYAEAIAAADGVYAEIVSDFFSVGALGSAYFGKAYDETINTSLPDGNYAAPHGLTATVTNGQLQVQGTPE